MSSQTDGRVRATAGPGGGRCGCDSGERRSGRTETSTAAIAPECVLGCALDVRLTGEDDQAADAGAAGEDEEGDGVGGAAVEGPAGAVPAEGRAGSERTEALVRPCRAAALFRQAGHARRRWPFTQGEIV